jgi:hypothetical protein
MMQSIGFIPTGIIAYDDLMGDEVALEGDDLKKRQFVRNRSRAPIEHLTYVDSDPSMCAWVFENHAVPTLLVSHPSHLPVVAPTRCPQFSPVKWSDIENAIDRVNVAKSKVYATPPEADLWQD